MSTTTTHLFPSITASITASIRAKLASIRERLSYRSDLRYSTGIECLQTNVVDNARAIQGLQVGASLSMARHDLTKQSIEGLLDRVEILETIIRRQRDAAALVDQFPPEVAEEDEDQMDLFKPVPQTDDDDYQPSGNLSAYGTNILHFGQVS